MGVRVPPSAPTLCLAASRVVLSRPSSFLDFLRSIHYDTNGFGTDIRPILSDSAAICQGVWRACTMAGLFKEKNAWHIRFYLRGKPCRKSPGPITERKARRAKQKVEARLADLKAGFLRIPENADLAEHLRSWPRRRSLVCGGDRTSRGSGSIACGTPSPAASARRASISDSLTTTWSIRRRGCATTTFPQSRDRRTVWRDYVCYSAKCLHRHPPLP